ncbi:hypothetical protein ACIBI4_04755 [Streptomyces sp. NPDC050418]|uniref:hypothetical protein n=1 Tax=Streptomyces sp. NPDC050418 TaxID=3365612 RepID=UPI0037AF1EC7
MAVELPDDLVELERCAWTAIQAGTLTVETAVAVQERIREYAAECGTPRLEIETALKRAVRYS